MPRLLPLAGLILLAAAPAAFPQSGSLFDGARGLPPAFRADGLPEVAGQAVPGWETAPPDQLPGDANPGAPERAGFWDRLQGSAFDQVCKSIRLQTSQGLTFPGYGGAEVKIDRELQRLPSGTFALVDRAGLDLSAGFSQSLLSGPEGAVSVSFGTTLGGESIVVRPLGTKKSCDEVKRLLDVLDVKAAVPLSPERIKAMQVGELWRLPLTLHIGLGLGAGLADFPAVVSLGRGKESRASVTLYRLKEDQVRFRLRIDKADIRSKDGSLVYTLPGTALGFPEVQVILVSQLERLVNRQIASAVARTLTANLGLSSAQRNGRMLMVEFILDPRDQGQMEALRTLMRGDLNALPLLAEMLKRAGRVFTGDRSAADELADVVGRHASDLGRDASFEGADDYQRRSGRFHFKLPVIVDHQSGKTRERDEILILSQNGEVDRVLKADKTSDWGYIDVPFLGQLTKHNTQRTAQVITHTDAAGNTTEPTAVFVRQEGFLREGAGRARDMAAEADSLASLIGTRGAGPTPATALPVDALFPKGSLMEEHGSPGPDGREEPREKTYRRGVTSFTLTFSRKAVADIAAAPADVVLRSYVQALGASERALMERVLPLMSLAPDGRLRYDERKALDSLGYPGWQDEQARGAMSELARLAQSASDVLRDLAAVRSAKTPQERAQRFLDLMDGDGRSGLKYEDVLRVLVQLADPADVSGEFVIRVDKGQKGEKDVAERLLLNPKASDGGLIGAASKNRARFTEPSILTD